MFKLAARTFRRLLRPTSRPAAIFLLWTHRRTVALWLRSIKDEVRHGRAVGGHDRDRWKRLLTSLWRVSNSTALMQENELRRLTVLPDGHTVAADVGEPWPDQQAFYRAGVEPVSTPVAPVA
jgi:hypothetical protein